MSTYNGQIYLAEQIDSILNQTYKYINLIIRDDGSNDSTPSILEDYANRYPEKIKIITDQKGNLGPKHSFAELMNYSTSEFIAFSDQDDFWNENKIERAINAISSLKSTNICLYSSDALVTDHELKVIHNSYFRKHHLLNFNSQKKINKLIFRNFSIGATSVFTKELKELSLPIPSNAIMHDWWIAINAAHYGEIYIDDFKSIHYRQHDNNVVGSRNYKFKFSYKTIKKLIERSNKNTHSAMSQAYDFYILNKENLPLKKINFIRLLLATPEKNFLSRIFFFFSYNLFKPKFLLSLAHFYSYLNIKKID